jgi:hypothetical protein
MWPQQGGTIGASIGRFVHLHACVHVSDVQNSPVACRAFQSIRTRDPPTLIVQLHAHVRTRAHHPPTGAGLAMYSRAATCSWL